ncbi:type VII secretion-associated serine protease mycosin [Actinomadura pelletieri DSM 43383]|uniref:Type VII secretion-associated serine protease mycosin n=1 Tax=Actinomadura pelletieri DSM 43383 TaxID=1120940 RepID=A0A495QHA7_9ACTN|nr:S8 family serine peptidase [Actinomadura pelletieri]RKS71111.1 type VII secretion-associated serine protease mycosin [Actinomadura pelletieri DSM 43383]
MRRPSTFALASAIALGAAFAYPLQESQAAAPCEQELVYGSPAQELPPQLWPQERLNFTDVWQHTRGAGVKVAVVDSGVDTTHPQLRGHVKAFDVTKSGLKDCVGHGTAVAGIIGAADMRDKGIPFVGVAPEAEIISVKMAVKPSGNDSRWTAQAIKRAVDLGARVINISSQSPDRPDLRQAVHYAQQRDVVIVSVAGNLTDRTKQTPQKAYPASYPGVISVGALAQDGTLAGFSNTVTPVTVTAPGQSVISTWPRGSYKLDDGTSLAAPYIAGTAALIRAFTPNLTYQQVKHRIETTADGAQAQGTGSGVVNPLRAVTTVETTTGNAPPPTANIHRVSIDQPPPKDTIGRNLALSITAAALATAAIIATAAIVIPKSHHRP